MANDLGLFSKMGLDIRMKIFMDGALAVAPMLSAEVDIGVCPRRQACAARVNLAARGKPGACTPTGGGFEPRTPSDDPFPTVLLCHSSATRKFPIAYSRHSPSAREHDVSAASVALASDGAAATACQPPLLPRASARQSRPR
jgi:hypothetical protein